MRDARLSATAFGSLTHLPVHVAPPPTDRDDAGHDVAVTSDHLALLSERPSSPPRSADRRAAAATRVQALARGKVQRTKSQAAALEASALVTRAAAPDVALDVSKLQAHQHWWHTRAMGVLLTAVSRAFCHSPKAMHPQAPPDNSLALCRTPHAPPLPPEARPH